jgi:hypothetical protein
MHIRHCRLPPYIWPPQNKKDHQTHNTRGLPAVRSALCGTCALCVVCIVWMIRERERGAARSAKSHRRVLRGPCLLMCCLLRGM